MQNGLEDSISVKKSTIPPGSVKSLHSGSVATSGCCANILASIVVPLLPEPPINIMGLDIGNITSPATQGIYGKPTNDC